MPHWHGAAVRLRYFGFSFSKRIFGFFRQRTGNRTGNGGRYTHHGHLWFTSRLCRRSPRLTPPERGIVSRFCAPVRDLRTPKTTRLHAAAAVTPYPITPPPPTQRTWVHETRIRTENEKKSLLADAFDDNCPLHSNGRRVVVLFCPIDGETNATRKLSKRLPSSGENL